MGTPRGWQATSCEADISFPVQRFGCTMWGTWGTGEVPVPHVLFDVGTRRCVRAMRSGRWAAGLRGTLGTERVGVGASGDRAVPALGGERSRRATAWPRRGGSVGRSRRLAGWAGAWRGGPVWPRGCPGTRNGELAGRGKPGGLGPTPVRGAFALPGCEVGTCGTAGGKGEGRGTCA